MRGDIELMGGPPTGEPSAFKDEQLISRINSYICHLYHLRI